LSLLTVEYGMSKWIETINAYSFTIRWFNAWSWR